ncbi:MAG TPA: hypothetical protein VK612_10600 [Pyrinomonadaceae bacterium]|nr:hypothetical protein [Pyrinomonadaceae bacterium]
MTNLEQIIINKIHRFPPEKQQKVLDYAESIETGDERESGNQTTWEMVKDFIEEVPEDAWNDVPTDSSINVDHYLYGHKKKPV